jgi:hypothetical protein
MSDLPDVQENNEQILNDIQSLQEMEQKLFNSLEINQNLTEEEKEKIITKMNELSNMRINLYKVLSNVNNYFENTLNTSVGSLKEQAIAVKIIENELNEAKKRMDALKEERNNKLRLVEINTYFEEKYTEHAQLMKIVIFTLIPIIVIVFLNNKGILPNFLFTPLLIIISFIGGYFFWRRFASIIMRDNMNYQEYNWHFNPSNVTSGTTSSTTTTDPWATTTTTTSTYDACVGDACCSNGLTYDSSLNQCIATTATTTTTATEPVEESFINNVLTKKQSGNYKTVYDLRELQASNY